MTAAMWLALAGGFVLGVLCMAILGAFGYVVLICSIEVAE